MKVKTGKKGYRRTSSGTVSYKRIRKFVSGSHFRRTAAEGGTGSYDGSRAKVFVIRRTLFSIRYLFERKIDAGNDDLS